MNRFLKGKKLNIIYSLLAVVLMWVVWVVSYFAVGNELLVPSFSETVKSFFGYFADGGFWLALGNSFMRTLIAFALSFVLAAALAAVSLFVKAVRAFLKPVMVFIRILPTMAAILIILKVSMGNRTLSSVAVTFLVLFPMIYSQFLAAFGEIDGGLHEMAKVYGIKKTERFFKIDLPLAAPSLLSQTGANLSLGFKIMLSAEVLAGAGNGLGYMMQQCSLSAGIAQLFALTLFAVVAGLLLEFVFSSLSKILVRWKNVDD